MSGQQAIRFSLDHRVAFAHVRLQCGAVKNGNVTALIGDQPGSLELARGLSYALASHSPGGVTACSLPHHHADAPCRDRMVKKGKSVAVDHRREIAHRTLPPRKARQRPNNQCRRPHYKGSVRKRT